MQFFELVSLLIFSNFIYGQTEDIFDVTKFGADTKAIDKSSEAIKKAIDAAINKGGGTVFFPKGKYLTGPIHLKSNITLELSEGTTILFSDNFDDYLPMVTVRWEGTVLKTFSPLIYAYKEENIVIKGKGVLDGQGKAWWDIFHKIKPVDSKYRKEFLRLNNLTEIALETNSMGNINTGFLRPPFLQPFESKNILIQDITVRNSPFWNINPVFCQNVTIRDVRIEAPYPSPNTDGIDPDSCKDVLISNVDIDVGDDCIAIKSGMDLQGRRIGRPTENVLITNVRTYRGISGVAIGSDQSGGVKNVTVKDCVFNGTDMGLYIKSLQGRGGIVEDIKYENISMTKIKYSAIIAMIYNKDWKMAVKDEPFSERTPVFRNIKFKDIRGDAQTSVILTGVNESLLQNIELNNIEITCEEGLGANYTTELKIKNFKQILRK